jgi:hypothetical protein
MRRLILLFAGLALANCFEVSAALALFDDNYALDAKFCDQPTIRTTVVYIDDMLMVEGQSDWAVKLSTKLRATVTPGERVTVVRLSPASGQSKEYWSGCWPEFPAAKKAELSSGFYIFQANPANRIADQKGFFNRDFGAALTRIYLDAKRPAGELQVRGDTPPPKQLLRALASDEGRFSNSTVTIRAIIFSDMAENSDLGSAFKPLPKEPLMFGQKLGSYLRRGVFYSFGMGEGVRGYPSFLENARAFWGSALRSMAAVVIGIGTDLNVPNTLPLRSLVWPITMDFGGQPLDGRVSLLIGEDGFLVDSWLGISRLGSAAITGTFRCTAQDDRNCRLDAETASGIATNAPTETLILSGSLKALSGTLGVKGQNTTFTLKTEQADRN